MAGHKVTVAGMINWVRQIITKNGKPMAFVELEDIQGTIEVVVFSRLYEQTRDPRQHGLGQWPRARRSRQQERPGRQDRL